MIDYLTSEEIKDVLSYYGKDTKRKQLIFLKNWLEEEKKALEFIHSQLKKQSNFFAWYLGERYTHNDCQIIIRNIELLDKFIKSLKN